MAVRVFALNAKTFAITHELPVSSVDVTSKLSGIGSWQAELPVTFQSPQGIEILTEDNFDTNRTVVAIVRDGVAVMMGLLDSESGTYDENTETLRVGGPELSLGYLTRRLWLSPRQANTADLFTQVNEIIFESDFLGLGQLIEISYEPSSTAGVSASVIFDQADRKSLYELLDDLSNLNVRFEYMGYASGTQATGFTTGILVGYPSIYRRTGNVLEFGKNIKKLSYTKDGKNYANVVQAGGAKKGQFTPLRSAVDGPGLATYPYFMRNETFNDIIDETQLQAAANRMLAITKNPPRRFEITINQYDPECIIGNWRLGDEFRLIARRGRLDVDSYFRVESWTLSVTSEGSEEVKMNMFETGTF